MCLHAKVSCIPRVSVCVWAGGVSVRRESAPRLADPAPWKRNVSCESRVRESVVDCVCVGLWAREWHTSMGVVEVEFGRGYQV